jgi:hypothetical protein
MIVKRNIHIRTGVDEYSTNEQIVLLSLKKRQGAYAIMDITRNGKWENQESLIYYGSKM